MRRTGHSSPLFIRSHLILFHAHGYRANPTLEGGEKNTETHPEGGEESVEKRIRLSKTNTNAAAAECRGNN